MYYLEYKTISLYFSLNASLKCTSLPICLFIPSFPFSKPAAVYYFIPFRNISSNTFTFCCNKINQPFTLTHNTHPFSCSTNSHLAILLAVSLCTFISPLNDIPLILSVCCHPSSKTNTITTFWILLTSHMPTINPNLRPFLKVSRRSMAWFTWKAVTGVVTKTHTG